MVFKCIFKKIVQSLINCLMDGFDGCGRLVSFAIILVKAGIICHNL